MILRTFRTHISTPPQTFGFLTAAHVDRPDIDRVAAQRSVGAGLAAIPDDVVVAAAEVVEVGVFAHCGFARGDAWV